MPLSDDGDKRIKYFLGHFANSRWPTDEEVEYIKENHPDIYNRAVELAG